VGGKTLHADYRSVVVDMCNVSVFVMVHGKASRDQKERHWSLFSRLLDKEGIRAYPHPAMEGIFVFEDAEHMRRFICKLPPPLQNVTPY
tara:strand:- start:2107 stop:2373 length:267 start_codon:yes stop_codon:yes gene_type:complete